MTLASLVFPAIGSASVFLGGVLALLVGLLLEAGFRRNCVAEAEERRLRQLKRTLAE